MNLVGLSEFASIAFVVSLGAALFAEAFHSADDAACGTLSLKIKHTPWLSHALVAVAAAGVCFWWEYRPDNAFEDCVLKHVKSGMSDQVANDLTMICASKHIPGYNPNKAK